MSVFGVFPALIFPAFELYMERYGVSLHIQSKCGKIKTRKTPTTDTFPAVFSKDLHKRIRNTNPEKFSCKVWQFTFLFLFDVIITFGDAITVPF